MSRAHNRRPKKQDPEVAEFAEEFTKNLDVRTAALKQAIAEYLTQYDDQMLQDIEKVGEHHDLEMPIGDYFKIRIAQDVSVDKSDAGQPAEPPKPLVVEGTPRVDAALPGGEHLRVPALIRPKIVEGMLNLRQPKPNEIAFSFNGTPLLMTTRAREDEEPMEIAEDE